MFKRLKNGKGSEAFYLIPNDVSYTIRLTSKEDLFQLNTYSFAGNDVSDESNCKDEKIENCTMRKMKKVKMRKTKLHTSSFRGLEMTVAMSQQTKLRFSTLSFPHYIK